MERYILTVECLAFNHEKYIRKTLEGFVKQKTNYQYKVIVHDDASTDGTAGIIKEFADKYPDLIFPIFQKENQYSKGVDIFENYIRPMLEGKYLASCEGDDYWTDENKLQLQIDYMEKHPECSLCVHNTELITEEGKETYQFINRCDFDRDYSVCDVIEADGGGLFQTSSQISRMELNFGIPQAFRNSTALDYPYVVFLAMNGNVHYIARAMSAYRIGAEYSWTQSIRNNITKKREFLVERIEELKQMDMYAEGKYHDSFQKMADRYECRLLKMDGKFMTILLSQKFRRIAWGKIKQVITEFVKR